MKRQLPGLGAFKSFEAAARHRSFSRAAEELGVTPAAVSYLVREIEAQLGVKLFHRTSRTVRLTDAGEVLNTAVAGALDDIGRAVERARSMDGQPRLNVTATPSFAIKWLVPRLNRFLQRFPDVDVRVDMSRHPVDFARDEMDLAIRFGTGAYPGLQVDRLLTDTVSPVCSPRLIKGQRPLRHPRDLRHHTLIHVDYEGHGETWPTWQMWMMSAGLTGIDATRGIHFDQGVLALQAAIDGQGVALGDSTLVATDLAAKRLVQPFELSLAAPPRFAYWIVVPPRSSDRPLVKEFRGWLLAEAAGMQQTAAPKQPTRSHRVRPK